MTFKEQLEKYKSDSLRAILKKPDLADLWKYGRRLYISLDGSITFKDGSDSITVNNAVKSFKEWRKGNEN
jgi:hypothetical protein